MAKIRFTITNLSNHTYTLLGELFLILETFDWLTQLSSQSEAFNIIQKGKNMI